MEHSIKRRLVQSMLPLFMGVLLISSLMVYLVETYTGVEAEVRVETAVTPSRDSTRTRWDHETAKTTASREENESTAEGVVADEVVVEDSQPTILITQTNPAYGLNRISNSELSSVPEAHYQNGLSTGATWDRWPMYWSRIEFPNPGEFHWDYQDTAVKGVIDHGLKLNAILLGTPNFYRTDRSSAPTSQPTPNVPTYSPVALDTLQSGVPMGLEAPIFADGTDIPGDGKAINVDNKWAVFVETAVNRYKPGGILAQQEGWAGGSGVTHWEMWNEPDLTHFWDGTAEDYARLLKVGYLAAKHADPHAQVIFGGLADIYSAFFDIPFLTAVLEIYDTDPLALSHNHFHDIIAVHNYSYAKRTWKAVYIAKQRLAARNLNNEIWLNESGVSVWDDYPGPVCDPYSPYRANMSEQANFIIQNALYARVNGADNIFFFSLYDECGNMPENFNPPYFPPEQCGSNPPSPHYAGDAFGLFRNSSASSTCTTQHPNPSTPRPSLAAYQMLTQYFVNVNWLWRAIPGQQGSGNGLHELIAFYQPHTQSRVLGMWAITNEPATAVFNSTNSQQTGLLISPDGVAQPITATNGVFTITLLGATNNNTPTGEGYYSIGGRPFLLIEQDDVAPTVSISASMGTDTRHATVSWQGNDLGSNIANYDITVSENEGLATDWLTQTTAVSASYTPLTPGNSYIFTVYGRDQAGNVSTGKSTTVFVPIPDNHVYLPIIQKP